MSNRKGIRHATLFAGEEMACIVCGKKETASPTVSSQWRCVVVGGQRRYACPAEFPPDGASRDVYETAYFKFLKLALTDLNKSVSP
jgi:hypothetical protein